MTITPSLQATRYRLAQHYLTRLRTAAAVVRRGQASVAYGLNLFDQDWAQIKQWQAWSAQRSAEGEEWTRLCKDFPLAGREVLTLRNHAADHVVWLETAFEAAQQLHDSEAERAILSELYVTYYRLGALETVEHVARQLLKLGEAAHDLLAIGRGFDGLGTFAIERGMYADAQQYYHRALEIAMELGIDAETGRALNGLGSVAFYLGDYQNAYDYFSRHLKLTELAGKKSEFCTALIALGEVLMRLKDCDGAEKCIRRAVEMCRTLGFQRLLGAALINLGAWATEQNQLQLASSYIEEGLLAVRTTGTQRQIIRGLFMLGYTRLRQENFSEALGHLIEGLQIAHKVGMPRYICDLQRTLANTYLALNNLDAARCALHESLTVAERLGSYPQKVRTLSSAVAYYHCRGWTKRAANWAGVLMGDVELDEALFKPVCFQLEATLGQETYHQALEEGNSLTLDETVAEALNLLR
jgi:tetratricopeptide (TPR) repeat protein